MSESIVISNKPRIYNGDKLKQHNLIFVVGLSDTSKKLVSKWNASYMSIDEFDSKWNHDEGWNKQYIKMRLKMMNTIKTRSKDKEILKWIMD